MINKVTLVGYLGGDPETRTLENGTPVGRFSLATSDAYKDKEGNWQNTTEWHNVVVWRELSERCQKLTKGQLVYVEGKISSRKYTDKDGVERTGFDIVANAVRLLEKREHTDQSAQSTPERERPAQSQVATHNPPPQTEGDDLPF
jgi:single-strand DNA-binding protein